MVPLTLIAHQPLAALTNGFLEAFNELRECAPLGIATPIASCIHACFLSLTKCFLSFHAKQHRLFDSVLICIAGFIPFSLTSCRPAFPSVRRSRSTTSCCFSPLLSVPASLSVTEPFFRFRCFTAAHRRFGSTHVAAFLASCFRDPGWEADTLSCGFHRSSRSDRRSHRDMYICHQFITHLL